VAADSAAGIQNPAAAGRLPPGDQAHKLRIGPQSLHPGIGKKFSPNGHMINPPLFFGLLSFLRAPLSIPRLSYPLGINNNVSKLKLGFSKGKLMFSLIESDLLFDLHSFRNQL
jgi:hypothetical protein